MDGDGVGRVDGESANTENLRNLENLKVERRESVKNVLNLTLGEKSGFLPFVTDRFYYCKPDKKQVRLATIRKYSSSSSWLV